MQDLGSDDIGPRKTVAFKPSLHIAIGCQTHDERLKSKILLNDMKSEIEMAGTVLVIGENVRATFLIGDRSSTCSR